MFAVKGLITEVTGKGEVFILAVLRAVVLRQQVPSGKASYTVQAIMCPVKVQNHVAIEVALLRKTFATLYADDRIGVNFFMHHKNIFPEKLFRTETTVQVSFA